jgi:hypothetical protein
MTESPARSAELLTLPRPVPDGVHPPLLSPAYRSTVRRASLRPLVDLPQRLTEVAGPLRGEGREWFGQSETVSGEYAVLRALPEPARRTLLAQPTVDGYRLDMVLQDDAETTLFRV